MIRLWFERIARKKQAHLTVFPLFMRKSESLPSIFAHLLFFKEPLERFAPVSDSLRSLMTKERQERFALFHKRESPFGSQNERQSHKIHHAQALNQQGSHTVFRLNTFFRNFNPANIFAWIIFAERNLPKIWAIPRTSGDIGRPWPGR